MAAGSRSDSAQMAARLKISAAHCRLPGKSKPIVECASDGALPEIHTELSGVR
jgi:hypothetical protein